MHCVFVRVLCVHVGILDKPKKKLGGHFIFTGSCYNYFTY